MSNEWPQLRPHTIQAAYWASKCRFNYLPCGRQSGKTELAMRKLVRHLPVAKPWSDPRYFFGSPTYKQAKKVAWQRIQKLIPREWIADISKGDLCIKTVFGSELFLVGLDQPQRVEGLILDGGVIDENSDIKPKTFDLSILPALAHRNGWTDFIGVPKRFGLGAVEYREKCQRAERGELPDSAVFAWPSRGVVPNDYLELCRATMDERDFIEQFEGVWLDVCGGIFHAFSREYNVRPCGYDSSLPIVVGSDFNVNPMAWVLGHIKGICFEVFDEIWVRNTNTPEALNILLRRYGTHKGGFQMYGDASARGRHTSAFASDYTHIANNLELKKLGRTMHYIRSNPPVADRFASTNAMICNGDGSRRVFVDPQCKHLILDLESRGYKPGTRTADDSGDIGHPTDALGYVLHKKWPVGNIIINQKNLIVYTGV